MANLNMTDTEYMAILLKGMRAGFEDNALMSGEDGDEYELGYKKGLCQAIGALDACLRLFDLFQQKCPHLMKMLEEKYGEDHSD